MSPGWCDRTRTGVTPESSTAVGSVQVTTLEVVPTGVVSMIEVGQLLTTGAVVSLRGTVGKERFKNIYIQSFDS